MADLPKFVTIQEEGPREGFQIEKKLISTSLKVKFIEALAATGLRKIDCVSYVNPLRVPGMADADEVARSINRKPGITYTGLWLNAQGFKRALNLPLDLIGSIMVSASEPFSIKNTGKNLAETLIDQTNVVQMYLKHNVPIKWGVVFTAFGCNFQGDVPVVQLLERIRQILDLADAANVKLEGVYLADTVGWAAPNNIEYRIGAVREKWPDLRIGLHLHDTRGSGIANAYAALKMGVDQFDSSCAGLGGCPFAGHRSAAGNICTEDLVFMCHELGIKTDIDLDRLIDCALMAEDIVGHPLPGKVKNAGGLSKFRNA